ncbi:N-acetylmannosamine-6-phosphate 2-epimerase [Staphylococcus sp. 17KM0847]|uniref:N-acetylmannosamine-6-phosphate 2-epimerase n=1 Tax=Staphylococcus sp. 17KM0847 TaxID=2583989 RepID=UPI0015DD178E|nr:N-acetylmannosamine-6-phosphate 2-epimerase [Staphylococcus sp. 17KM0847]QLK85364.1 N-acetylmannosamine-6-phosphate 2-epimerase [Staphylococcus sp. 17KM0847]
MKLPQGLIVSCQALEDEPLHSSYIMSKMALAAKEGGAVGIRANTKEDIIAIKKEVELPVIGIVKRDYPNSSVFITATQKEVDELLESGCEVIALDATLRARPVESLEALVQYVRQKAPDVELMADIATLEEAINAEHLGFDYIGTTLHGYTEETKGCLLYDDDFKFLVDVLENVNQRVIAEGNVITPEMLKKVFDKGVYASVVGGAITRPRDITKRFVKMIEES